MASSGVPSRDSNSGLPYNKPTMLLSEPRLTILIHAAP